MSATPTAVERPPPLSEGGGPGGPSPVALLPDYIRRLEKHRTGRSAVHIRLSALMAFNRREQHVRAAASGFEALILQFQGQLFVLANSDLLLFYRTEAQPDVETEVRKVCFLFGDDPLFGDPRNRLTFVRWYNLADEYDAVLRLARGGARMRR